jgi:hypothetical protein
MTWYDTRQHDDSSRSKELTRTAVVKSKIRHKPQDKTVKGFENNWG